MIRHAVNHNFSWLDSCGFADSSVTTSGSRRVSTTNQPLYSNDVWRTLHFFSPPLHGERPTFVVTEPTGVGSKNYECSTHLVLIRDIRSHSLQKHFDLSIHAFQLLTNVPAPTDVDLSCITSIRTHYYADATNLLLKHVPGASKVVIFDHTIRRASAHLKLNRPVRKVHIDQTPYASLLRAKRHLEPEDVEAVMAGRLRLRIINVWRPLRGPLNDHPLCVAESCSIADEDLIEVDHVYHDRVGQTYAAKFNPDQRFWYFSRMEPTDVWLIQCVDSVKTDFGECGKRHVRCAHASFQINEDGEAEMKERESIEIRCLVLGGELS